jgi:ferredoxin-type protein NapH
MNVIIVIVGILSAGFLIYKRWIFVQRGFVQFGLFFAGEIAFFCNKGMPCANCPLSFGLCPMGLTQRLAFMAWTPAYLIIALVVVIGLIFGSLVCGWACPLGFMQELLGSGKFKKIRLPESLKVLRLPILAVVIGLVFLEWQSHFFSHRGLSLFNEAVFVAGGLVLLASFFINRPFCRICPLGMIYGWFNRFSPVTVRLNKEKCAGCGACLRVCPVDIEPTKKVNGELCIKCFNCRKVCEV